MSLVQGPRIICVYTKFNRTRQNTTTVISNTEMTREAASDNVAVEPLPSKELIMETSDKLGQDASVALEEQVVSHL